MFNVAAVGFMLVSMYLEYPAFIKRGEVVEAYTDRGMIVEMIVRCPTGSGILSYSKVERLYCSSKHVCTKQLQPAVDDTCR